MATAAETTNSSSTEFSRPADKYIWGAYLALVFISIIEVSSASSPEVSPNNIFGPIIRHGITLALGVAVTFATSRLNYRHLLPLTPLMVLLSIILAIVVFIFGFGANNAVRSIEILGFQLQSSEFIKLSAVAVIALVASKSQDKEKKLSARGVRIIAICVALFGGLLITQGLTNTVLLMAISVSMMFLGGIRWRHLGLLLVVYMMIGVGVLFIHSLIKSDDSKDKKEQTTEVVQAAQSDVQVAGEQAQTAEVKEKKSGIFGRSGTWNARLDRWLNGDTVPLYKQPITDENRQVVYSLMAQAHGGVIGNGPGNSREVSRLPLPNIDYIYSIVVEDWGFVGGIIVLVIYLSILFRAGRIASRCRRAYPAMMIIGMAVFIVFEALFHIGINTGFFPVSGQPLPMISKGGTSILVTSFAFGIMLSVSRTAAMSAKKEENADEKENLPEDMQAENPGMIK